MLTRFGLQSTQTGLISSAYDIGSLVVMIPVSYYGGRPGASKPRTVTLPPHRVLISATSWPALDTVYATSIYSKYVIPAAMALTNCGCTECWRK